MLANDPMRAALTTARTVLKRLGVAVTTEEHFHFRGPYSDCDGCTRLWIDHCILCKLPIPEEYGTPEKLSSVPGLKLPGFFVEEPRLGGRLCDACYKAGTARWHTHPTAACGHASPYEPCGQCATRAHWGVDKQ